MLVINMKRYSSYVWIMLPYPKDELGLPKCLIPLMTVKQNKQNICPALDYRELNGFMDADMANSEVCAQKL